MTVSAPQRIAQTILSTSSATLDEHRRVADVGVDLDQEVAADGHRLQLGVVDVGRDDGAAAGDLVADELRACTKSGIAAPKSSPSRMNGSLCLAAQVLADGDVFHLRR